VRRDEKTRALLFSSSFIVRTERTCLESFRHRREKSDVLKIFKETLGKKRMSLKFSGNRRIGTVSR
jgi:hypothetical protein